MDVTNTPSRSRNIEALAYCYVFNILLLISVGHGYLASVPSDTSRVGWLATLLAFVANFALLALVPALLCLGALVSRRLWVMLTAVVILFGLLNVFIYADLVIYKLWRFHFNGFVWNLLTTPGSGDNTIAGKGTILYSIGSVALIFATEIAFVAFVLPWLLRQSFSAKLRNRKSFTGFACAVLVLILLNIGVYDVADLRGNIEVLRVKQLFPLYQAVTMRKFAIKVLGMRFPTDMRVKVPSTQGSFFYPKEPLRFRTGGPRPNILIIPIEGGRFDMLTPDVMPFLSHWSESNLVFRGKLQHGQYDPLRHFRPVVRCLW